MYFSAAAVVGAAAVSAADAGPAAAAAEEKYENQNDPEAGITAVAVSTKHFLIPFSAQMRVSASRGLRGCSPGTASDLLHG